MRPGGTHGGSSGGSGMFSEADWDGKYLDEEKYNEQWGNAKAFNQDAMDLGYLFLSTLKEGSANWVDRIHKFHYFCEFCTMKMMP